MKTPDPVRWFDEFGSCRCGKPADGRLMGERNESYGLYCRRCAAARLKKADAERRAWLKQQEQTA